MIFFSSSNCSGQVQARPQGGLHQGGQGHQHRQEGSSGHRREHRDGGLDRRHRRPGQVRPRGVPAPQGHGGQLGRLRRMRGGENFEN